ncbi:unnamed protein product [Rotaria sp. Silwood2]|nr:unnamed protein product [Rotaria sp. Silwood2]
MFLKIIWKINGKVYKECFDLSASLNLLKTQYEKVVRDDRAEKERKRRQLEREEQQMNAAVKIQSWWRGMLLRHAIGPHKKKKGKKGKKKKK